MAPVSGACVMALRRATGRRQKLAYAGGTGGSKSPVMIAKFSERKL